MPIIMLWLGVGDITKTLVIFLGVSLPVIYHSFEGAKAVEEKMLWSGAAMGLSPLQRLVRIVLPAALPEILTGCRTGLVLALITMITSEMIARQSGAGNILFNALDMGQYDTVFAMIIIVGAMGICLDALFERVRAQAGALVRASVRHAVELLMNARVAHHGRHSRARADRAGDRAVAGPRVIWLCACGVAAAAGRVSSAAAPATRDLDVPAGDRGDPVPAVCRLCDCGRPWRQHRHRGGRQSGYQRRGSADRAGAGAVAESRALSGPAAAARLRSRIEDHAGGGGRAVSHSAVHLLRRLDGRAEADLVGHGGGNAALANPVQGRAAGSDAVDPDRLPDRPCHFLHRGVSGRDDHVDRRPRPCAGDGGPDLPGRRHVRAADHDLAAGIDPEWPAGGAAIVPAAGFPEA